MKLNTMRKVHKHLAIVQHVVMNLYNSSTYIQRGQQGLTKAALHSYTIMHLFVVLYKTHSVDTVVSAPLWCS